MNKLLKLECEACGANAKILTPDEINVLLLELEDWELIIESNIQKLKRVFVTKNYPRSIAFTNAVADLAKIENHHPLLIVEYGTVTVIWWTHAINGLHKNDFIMAAKTSSLF